MIITLRTATTDFLARLDSARLGRQRQIARCCAIVGRRRQSFRRIRSFLADLTANDDKAVVATADSARRRAVVAVRAGDVAAVAPRPAAGSLCPASAARNAPD